MSELNPVRFRVFRVQASVASFTKYLANQVVFMFSGTAMLWVFVEFGAVRPEVAYIITLGAVTVGIFYLHGSGYFDAQNLRPRLRCRSILKVCPTSRFLSIVFRLTAVSL